MHLPQRKQWEDSHSRNDLEAQAVILMWHLSERGTCCGMTSWADVLGQFKIRPQTCESDGAEPTAEPGPFLGPIHQPRSAAVTAQPPSVTGRLRGTSLVRLLGTESPGHLGHLGEHVCALLLTCMLCVRAAHLVSGDAG